MYKKFWKCLFVFAVIMFTNIMYVKADTDPEYVYCDYGDLVLRETSGYSYKLLDFKVIYDIKSDEIEPYVTFKDTTGKEYKIDKEYAHNLANDYIYNGWDGYTKMITQINKDADGNITEIKALEPSSGYNDYELYMHFDDLLAYKTMYVCPSIVVSYEFNNSESAPDIELFYDKKYLTIDDYCKGSYYDKLYCVLNEAFTGDQGLKWGLKVYPSGATLSDELRKKFSEAQHEYEKLIEMGNPAVSTKIGFCVDYLGSASDKGSTAHMLDNIFDIFKIAAIILGIMLSMIDLFKVITSGDSNLKAAFQTISKRIVIILIVLLLPTLIEMLFGLFGFEDVLCGIK